MAIRARIREGMTLEEFLQLPDDKPYLEYLGGRTEAKPSLLMKQSLLIMRLTNRLNGWAKPARLGLALPVLRCTFAGWSIVADVVFLLKQHIAIDARGRPVDETLRPPDLHVEVTSPEEGPGKSREKLTHSTANGCALGWLIDPRRKTIDVYRSDRPAERMAPDAILEGEPVLPGFRLPVAEVFGWLRLDL